MKIPIIIVVSLLCLFAIACDDENDSGEEEAAIGACTFDVLGSMHCQLLDEETCNATSFFLEWTDGVTCTDLGYPTDCGDNMWIEGVVCPPSLTARAKAGSSN